MIARNLNRAKRGEVRGDELTIEQGESTSPHPRNKMRERDF